MNITLMCPGKPKDSVLWLTLWWHLLSCGSLEPNTKYLQEPSAKYLQDMPVFLPSYTTITINQFYNISSFQHDPPCTLTVSSYPTPCTHLSTICLQSFAFSEYFLQTEHTMYGLLLMASFPEHNIYEVHLRHGIVYRWFLFSAEQYSIIRI